MNDLPVTEVPPNVAHLVCTADGEHIQPDVAELNSLHFEFDIVPFIPLFNSSIKRLHSYDNPTFGLSFEDDPVLR